MKKQYTTYKIALLFKELGFDEKCLGYFIDGKLEDFFTIYKNSDISLKSNSKYKDICTAPLWQQAIDWLNNRYGIFITLSLVGNGYGFYIHKNYNTTNKGDNYGMYPTLYIARKEAILKAIEIIKNE